MSLTAATWNVENFALPAGGTSAAVSKKLTRIAETLAALDADVIALQEILDEHAAGQIASALNRLPATSTYAAVNGEPDRRHNRVAVLSRLPIVATETESLNAWQLPAGQSVMRLERTNGEIVVVPEPTLPRPPLRVRVRLTDGTSIDVINVHLKSKLIAFPGGGFSTHDEALRALATELTLQRRIAEATTVRARVNHLLAEGRRVVVLGDFNAEPDAVTTHILCGSREHSDAHRLIHLTDQLPVHLRWSRKGSDGQREMLDQILVSPGVMQAREDPREQPTLKVLHDAAMDGTSDHVPVYATFPALR